MVSPVSSSTLQETSNQFRIAVKGLAWLILRLADPHNSDAIHDSFPRSRI
jgi:hypothetical protein